MVAESKNITRTMRFEVALVCRKADRDRLQQRLWRASDELRAAMNRATLELLLLKSGVAPWPVEPGKKGKNKGVEGKVPELTLCYRLVAGNWSMSGQLCYQPEPFDFKGEKLDATVASGSHLLAQSIIATRMKTDWLDIRRGLKSAPTFRSVPLGTAQGNNVKFREDGIIEIPIWSAKNKITGAKQASTVAVRPVRLDGSLASILKRIRLGEYKPGQVFLKWDKSPTRKGKWFVCVQWTGPIEQKAELEASRILGVDLGIVHPASCIVFESTKNKFAGSLLLPHPTQVTRSLRRRQAELRERRMYRNFNTGKGRKYATRSFAAASDKIARATETALEQIAAAVVQHAIKHRCKTIAVEDLAHWSHRRAMNWGDDKTAHERAAYRRSYLRFHQGGLREKIKAAAQKALLNVIEVPARYTSKTCSACGKIWDNGQEIVPVTIKRSKGGSNRKGKQAFSPGSGVSPVPRGSGATGWGRLDQGRFACSCGHNQHADLNAAANIARLALAPSESSD
jgi:transposase